MFLILMLFLQASGDLYGSVEEVESDTGICLIILFVSSRK